MNKNRKTISYGDKIFARVTRNGRTILNFMTEKVSNMTELLGELRIAMKDLKGLVILHIRNYNRGWGEERPLMLYAQSRMQWPLSNAQEMEIKHPDEKKMLFPWQVH